MKAFSESKLAKYEDIESLKYFIFDEYGDLIGVKDDAPPDIKEAYEADKKIDEKWAELGID